MPPAQRAWTVYIQLLCTLYTCLIPRSFFTSLAHLKKVYTFQYSRYKCILLHHDARRLFWTFLLCLLSCGYLYNRSFRGVCLFDFVVWAELYVMNHGLVPGCAMNIVCRVISLTLPLIRYIYWSSLACFVIRCRIVHSFRDPVITSILPMNRFRAALLCRLNMVLLNMAMTSDNA